MASVAANVSELSAKLLEGCKLVADSCPETNVPLVITPQGKLYSVGNQSYYQKINGTLSKLVPPQTTNSDTPDSKPKQQPQLHSPHAKVEQDLNTQDRMGLSALVAQKLLEGFTLLSESCPTTNVPLVQNQAGHILSVGTGTWYTRRGATLVPAATSPGKETVTSPPSVLPVPRYETAEFPQPLATPCAPGSMGASLHSSDSILNPTPSGMCGSSFPGGAPRGAGPATGALGEGQMLPPHIAGEVDATFGILTHTLAEARQALSRASMVSNTTSASSPDVASIVAVIKDTAQAMVALRSLS